MKAIDNYLKLKLSGIGYSTLVPIAPECHGVYRPGHPPLPLRAIWKWDHA
jgi:hypothetical protein